MIPATRPPRDGNFLRLSAPGGVPILRRRDRRAPDARRSGNRMNVLVAGGAGYIGSHTVRRLKEAGHSPVIYDNLSRGHRTVVDILKVPAVAADLNDRPTLVQTLREHRI